MLARCIDDLVPGFPIITVSSREGVEVLHKLMHLGIREHLTSPIQESTLADAVEAVRQRLRTHPVSAPALADLYTFLPAKPGVGTSTIAVSTSCALAEDLGVKTLLLDSDLAAGTIQFLLKLGSTASVVDALAHAENLDEDLWFQMVGKWDKLEVLHAGELDTPPGMAVPGVEHVLSMARAQYEVICADLGSHFDPLSIALLRESRRIFLVTTPEVAPLHLARTRMHRLSELGLSDRVSLLLNRKVRSVVTDSDVEKTVGIPVSYSFSNDYPGVQKAILRASPVSQGSDLGESILNLAHSLVPHREPIETSHRRKFLKFFHIPHMEDAEVVWHG
jgi:pilus assembly protein CpaE